MSISVSYPVFDADNHMYETTDAFTKYLPAEYEGLVKFVQVNGRTKIALRNVISDYIPNPTFNKVAPPGAQELEFRIKNPSSKHSVGTTVGLNVKAKNEPRLPGMPPKYIESPAGVLQPGRPDHPDGRAAGRPSDDVAHPGQPARGAPGRRPQGHCRRGARAQRVDARALDASTSRTESLPRR